MAIPLLLFALTWLTLACPGRATASPSSAPPDQSSNLGFSSVSPMAAVSSSGNSTTIQMPGDYTIAGDTVSYPAYSYYATVCVYDSNTRLYSVRVWYQKYDVFLPLIKKP